MTGKKETPAEMLLRLGLELNTASLKKAAPDIEKVDKALISIQKNSVELREEVDRLKESIKKYALESGESFKFAADAYKKNNPKTDLVAMKHALTEVTTEAKAMKSVVQTFKNVSNSTRETETATGRLKAAWNGLGTVAKTVFGFTLANIVTRVVQSISRYFREAVEAGIELERSLFRVVVGIRALQSVGMDVTIGDFVEEIQRLRDVWGVFSKKELIEGVGYMTILTREIGLTKEQMFGLMNVTSALTILMGKDMSETLRQVSLAISSGYSEALQRVGMNINKVVIAEKAHELGINKTFMAMTGEERALATLTLIMEQSNAVIADAKKFQETHAGSIDKSKSSLEYFTAFIGKMALPIVAAFYEALVTLTDAYINWGRWSSTVLTNALMNFHKLAALVTYDLNKAFGDGAEAAQLLADRFQEIEEANAEAVEKIITQYEMFDFFLKDLADVLPQYLMRAWAGFEMPQEVIDAFDDLEDIVKNTNDRIEDNIENFNQSVLDKARRFAASMAAAAVAYAASVARAMRSANNRITDENSKFNNKLVDAQIKFAQKREDILRSGRERELDNEKDYQEELRKLREQLIFDLDDAVRARDASQIRRLIRQANFRKGELRKDREDQIADNKDRLKRELEDNQLKYKRELRLFVRLAKKGQRNGQKRLLSSLILRHK